jgi:hypothetical protein
MEILTTNTGREEDTHMADMRPDSNAGVGPEPGPKPGIPRWVKVGIITLVVLVLLVVMLTLTGVHEPGPGPGHGP